MKKSQNMQVWVPNMVFWSAKLHTLQVVDLNRRSNPACAPAETPIMNYDDLTAAQCFWLAHHHNDWSRWFAISTPPSPVCFAVPVSVLWVGLQKSKIPTQTWMWKHHFWRVTTYSALLEMLLSLIRLNKIEKHLQHVNPQQFHSHYKEPFYMWNWN
jgi:hypothetical protein